MTPTPAKQALDWLSANTDPLTSEDKAAYETIKTALQQMELITETIETFSKRSNYVWSSGGEYTDAEHTNEGALSLANLLLEKLNSRGKV